VAFCLDQHNGLLWWSNCINGWGKSHWWPLSFCKAFDKLPHNTVLSKLERYGFDGWTVRWMRNWLQDWIQRVLVNGSMSAWKSVTNGVPQQSVIWLILFNIFICDTDNGGSVHPQQVCRWHQVVGCSQMPNRWDDIQRDLVRFKQWAQQKCEVQ